MEEDSMQQFKTTLKYLTVYTFLFACLLLPSHAYAQLGPSLIEKEWQYSVWGNGIGLSGITTFDIDGDDKVEMIMGGSGTIFGKNTFWYVVKETTPQMYEKVWISDEYSVPINRIAVADTDADGIGEIFVGMDDGTVKIYNGLTMVETGSFISSAYRVVTMEVADTDGDGFYEIAISDDSSLFIYSATTFDLEWYKPGPAGSSIAVGNVDGDGNPEIITTEENGHGYVIDGATHALEWDYINSFGNLVEVADIDQDGKAEIIGASSWYKITIFDGDIHSPKWEIPTDLDVDALYVGDVDGNIPEILYGDGQWGEIHCIDVSTQTEKWNIRNPDHGVTDIAVGDVDSDGTLEVIWGAGASSTGADYLYIAGVDSQIAEWQNDSIDGPLSAVDVGDVDNDGVDEIVMVSFESESGYESGVVYIFDAVTHALEYRDLLSINDWMGVRTVKIGDVDDDGESEYVIATANLYDGVIQIYNGQTHALERQSPWYNGNYFTDIEIGDVDNDGSTEIVAVQGREHTGAPGVYIIVFDGATAAEEWKSIDLGIYWGYVEDIELSDIDNDGNTEICASLPDGRVYVFDGVTHQLDWIEAVEAYALEAEDVDRDGQKELLIGGPTGSVAVYDGSTFRLETTYQLGTGPIVGILVDDIDGNGAREWVISDSTMLYVYKENVTDILWEQSNIGANISGLNHMICRDIDFDGRTEIVFGSGYALFQFEVQHLSNSTVGMYQNNNWYLDANGSMAWEVGIDFVSTFGKAGDVPVTGDWNGDGATEVGVVRGNRWYLDVNGHGAWDAGTDVTFPFGKVGDIPMAGDWNGDGYTEAGVVRGNRWYIDMNGDNAWDSGNDATFPFGKVGDIPISGDWNGDGYTEAGVVRGNRWYVDMNGDNAWGSGNDATFPFGKVGDIPISGDWNGDGYTEVGIVRGTSWYLDADGSGSWDGTPTDTYGRFGGSASWIPVTGKW